MSVVDTVEIVTLNWNGRQHLETCLEALDRQEGITAEWSVVVVDNGSSDGSVEWLEREWPSRRRLGRDRRGSLRVLPLDRNLGFCVANNLAVESSGADAVVFLNNDTAPRADWLTELVRSLAEAPADVAAVSGRLVDWEERRIDFVEGIMTFDGHAFQRGFRKPVDQWRGPDSGAELPFACGGNMIVRRPSFLDAGSFDPAYFAYLEDVDLGWRLWSGGERVLFCNEAEARHRSMATSDQLGQDRRGFLFERNAMLTALKNYDEEHRALLMPAILWTFLARTRTLLAENNEGGEWILHDPYAGESPAEGVPGGPPSPTLWQKWRGWGSAELARRAVHRGRRILARWIAPADVEEAVRTALVQLDDTRSLAQLQAANDLLDRLEAVAVARTAVQRRRRRPDRNILERFPLYLVPTYPGDERLFGDAGFRALLPSGVPIVEATLDELMEME